MNDIIVQEVGKKMKKNIEKLQKEILFYTQKLPLIKQIEALDFIKWLWGGPSSQEEFTKEEIEKLEKSAKDKKGRAFKTGEALLKHLDNLSKE
jgi:ubiquinone/menaquinone biosynthesis C-methylase UbiE